MERFKSFLNKIGDDDIFTLAAALAYFTALSVAPLIVLMVSFLSFLDYRLQQELLTQTQGLMGDEVKQVLEAIISSANHRPDLSVAAGWVGIIVLAFSASVIFAQLQSSLNLIFRVPKNQNGASAWHGVLGFVKRRLLSMGILLGFIFILVVSLLVSAAVSYLIAGYDFTEIRVLLFVANFLVFSFLFFLIYKFVPDRKVRISHSVLASIITALLFLCGKSLIGSYIGQTGMASAYGAAGSLVALLAWIYYSALIFFVGAEVSSFFWLKEMLHEKN